MEKSAYKITIGSISIQDKNGDASLISLSCELSALSCFCYCSMEISITDNLDINFYDKIIIKLGEEYDTVFTGFVIGIEYGLASIVIRACSNEKKLNEYYHDEVFKENSVGDIIKNLTSLANVDSGEIENGFNLLNYRVTKAINILKYIKELSWISGSYLYFDNEGKLNTTKAGSKTNIHECKMTDNVISYNINKRKFTFEAVEVWGESASSTSGSDRWHWLVKDLASVYGLAAVDFDGNVVESKTGNNLKVIKFGAIKSGESASKCATSLMLLEAERKYRGRIKIIGDSSIKLLDMARLITPDKQSDFIAPVQNEFRIIGITHSICSEEGFVTTVEI